MMWILGGLMLFLFVQTLVGMQLMPADQFHHQWEQAVSQSPQAPPFSESFFRACMTVVSIAGVLVGITAVALAFGVKRGHRGTIIAATIFASFMAVGLGLLVLAGLVQVAIAPAVLGVVLGLLIPLGATVLLLFWLLAAIRPGQPSAGFAIQSPQVAAAYPPEAPGYAVSRPTPPAPLSILGYGYPGLEPPPPPVHAPDPQAPSNETQTSKS
jgi:hypothetical protein